MLRKVAVTVGAVTHKETNMLKKTAFPLLGLLLATLA